MTSDEWRAHVTRALALALALALATSCDRDPRPHPQPTGPSSIPSSPSSIAAPPAPAPPAQSAFPPDAPFPPRWSKGQRWRVRMAAPGLQSGFRLVPFDYVVERVPGAESGAYVLAVRQVEAPGDITFQLHISPQGAFSSARALHGGKNRWDDVRYDHLTRGPFLGGPPPGEGGWPILLYPSPPRAAPPGPLADALAPTDVRQRVEPRPGGVDIVVEQGLPTGTRKLTWTFRSGDPWWRTLREERRFVPVDVAGEAVVEASTQVLGELDLPARER